MGRRAEPAASTQGGSAQLSPRGVAVREGTHVVGHLDKLNPSELFALAMQAGVLKDKGKPFVMALTNGKFPIAELEKFVNGQPSMVDAYASGGGIGGDALMLGRPTARSIH